MSLVVKIIAGLLAAIVLLLGIAALYLFTVFDPNDFKDEIRQLVHDETGLDLGIEGDLALSVFPWLGVSTGRMTLDAPDGALGSLDAARIYARTGPLFRGELEVRGISLERLRLKLTVAENGRPNWAFTPPGKGDMSTASAEPASPAALPLAAFTVAELSIIDSDITYQDLQQDSYHQLSDLALTTRDVNLAGGSFPIDASFSYRNSPTAKAVPVSFSSDVTPRLDPLGAQLDDVSVSVANASLSGTIAATNLEAELPGIVAELQGVNLNPADWGALLNDPELAALDFPMTLALSLNLDSAASALTVSKFELGNESLMVSGDLSASQLLETPKFSANLRAEAGSTRKLLTRLGIDIAGIDDPELLGPLSLRTRVEAADTNIAIPELAVQLDDITLNGNITIKDTSDPYIEFQLQSGPLNLDRYFPPAAGEAEPEAEVSAAEVALLPLAAMRELNSAGRISIAKLIVSGLELNQLELDANARDGLIKVTSLRANLYDGTLVGEAAIDARSDTPKIATRQKLSGVQAAPVLKQLADIDAIAGRLNLDLDTTTSGNNSTLMTANLNGAVQVTVSDGQLNGIDLERMVCSAIATMRQIPLASAASATPLTRFKQLDSTMQIRNGVLHTDALNLAIEKIRASGTGALSLVDNTLDYRFKALLVGDLTDPACRVSEQFREIEWPVRCRGSLEGEIGKLCGLDSDGMKKIVEAQLRNRAKEAITEKLGGDAGKLLEGLFGR